MTSIKQAKPVREHGVIAVFAANMLPTPPFAVQNMIAGAMRVKVWEFLAGTAIALIPGILAWTVFGDQIMNALDAESKVNFWLIGAALLFFAAFILSARRFLKQRGLQRQVLVDDRADDDAEGEHAQRVDQARRLVRTRRASGSAAWLSASSAKAMAKAINRRSAVAPEAREKPGRGSRG